MRDLYLFEAVPPFRLDLTVWVLRRRADNHIDQWDGTTYQRVLLFDDIPVQISVKQISESSSPKLQVAVIYSRPISDLPKRTHEKLKHMLGLELDLSDFYNLADEDPHLRPLARYFKGLKPPRFPSIYETVINAIACQQVSLTVGIQLLNRLAAKYGRPFEDGVEDSYAFPLAKDLAMLDLETLRSIGFSRQKSNALLQLSLAIMDDQIELENLADLENDQIINKLMGLRGIGLWSSEYTLLRGFGRLDSFPEGDVGARKSLSKWLNIVDEMDATAINKVLKAWQPYRGLVYFHLLLKGLSESGVLPMQAERSAN